MSPDLQPPVRRSARSRRFTALLGLAILAVAAAIVVPRKIAMERRAQHEEGILVRYESSIPFRYYPVVRVLVDGRPGPYELRSVEYWKWKWYDIGDRVPVLEGVRGRAVIGSAWIRWNTLFVPLGSAVLLIIALFLPDASPKNATSGGTA